MSQFEDLEGGELAAAITPAQRMDMVQGGYNPMSPDDVQRYYKNQRPAEGLHEVAGVKKYMTLGGGKEVDQRDAGMLSEFERETGSSLTDGPQRTGNPRDDVRGAMDSYGAGSYDLDSKIARISAKVQNSQRQLPEGRQQPRQQEDRRLIATPKQSLPIINESAKAKKVGYTMGIRYINAFIANVKAPSSANRAALIKEMNSLILIEDKIEPQLIKEYRQGIAVAEAELYNKIKTSKS